MSAAGVRARVRAQMTEEIKAVARRHLAAEGANLSLRAVARDLGMASSAVYRYFPSRDELLTALIIDAYDAVGLSAEQAVGAEGDPLGRFLAGCHAVREWALANPHEWALIYGSPVPGYQAPTDTIGPALRVLLLIARIGQDALTAGRITVGPAIDGRYAEELAAASVMIGYADIPPQVTGGVIGAYFQLCGAVSAELFGQLNQSVDEDRRGFLELEVGAAGRFIGLG